MHTNATTLDVGSLAHYGLEICENCDGTGEMWWPAYHVGSDYEHREYRTCPICSGRGTVEA